MGACLTVSAVTHLGSLGKRRSLAAGGPQSLVHSTQRHAAIQRQLSADTQIGPPVGTVEPTISAGHDEAQGFEGPQGPLVGDHVDVGPAGGEDDAGHGRSPTGYSAALAHQMVEGFGGTLLFQRLSDAALGTTPCCGAVDAGQGLLPLVGPAGKSPVDENLHLAPLERRRSLEWGEPSRLATAMLLVGAVVHPVDRMGISPPPLPDELSEPPVRRHRRASYRG
jgi:hypothetical protein